jgi:zinc and cadmium transporter
LDGLIIGVAFLVDIQLGLVAVAAVALHEIPQEFAEFGVLLYAGFSKTRALIFNFVSASMVIFGTLIGFWLGEIIEAMILSVIMLAVGTFIYVAASDFVPELQKEKDKKRSIQLMVVFMLGIFVMWAFTFFE